jgi:serine/threonine-protein kinase
MTIDLGRNSIVEWAESAAEGGPDLIREEISIGREERLHFIAEAQATSQLEHPGIPPVHDLGLTEDGRLYFTMKLVQGRTLREVLHDLVLKRREVHRRYSLHKLISILERVCEPLHFSHEKGVIHRDLKPENIMLGDYGEVHVMDWGLARIDQVSSELPEIGAVETAREDAGLDTQNGAVKGTLPYMSPEQIEGEEIDRRSDIYALGCLLYEILTLQAAFEPRGSELLSKKRKGQFADVATVNPRRIVPETLAVVCRKAMATDPAQRYATVQELSRELRRWLDGRAERGRRHEEAEALAAKGREAAARYERLENEVVVAEGLAEAEAEKYKPFQPVSEKRPLIVARKRVATLQTEAVLAFAEATQLLNAALTQESDNAAARAALAGLWLHRLAEAERRGDPAGAASALAMAERYADKPVPSDGSLTIESLPAGAELTIHRLDEVDGVLTPREERSWGTAPVGPVPLAMGSYLCVLRKDGYRDTRYPVHITRERAWRGEVKLKTDEEIGASFVHVPAGPFTYGEGSESEIRHLPDFAIAKYPVTFAEYGEFLDALDAEEAERRCPGTPGDGPFMERGPDGKFRPLPNSIEGPARERCLQEYGPACEQELPVAGVSWDDAVAYCEWKTKTTGREWRLPTEEEREKAARGVDGRMFPWGDLADSSLGKCRDSRDEPAQPEPVGKFPTAESIYGMGDAAGNQWEWADSWFDAQRASRVLRGGSWGGTITSLRCANRYMNPPQNRFSGLGFRCARSL